MAAQAWGTGGLQPHELRGVLHALQRASLSGRPAQLFISRLKERVAALPPPDDDDTSLLGAQQSSVAGSASPKTNPKLRL
eukprot:3357411-Prymnesium_polylepis.1